MSLVKKYFLGHFIYKPTGRNIVSVCSYLFKDSRMNCAQYYTCLNNSGNIQSRVFKHKRLDEGSRRVMSILPYLKEKQFDISMRLKSWSRMLPSFLPFLGTKYRKLGFLWFKTLDEVNTQDFFTVLKMPDTFHSRFQIIELHVWMLLAQLPQEGRINRFIRVGVIQAMWEDSQKRAKVVEEMNINFKKNFRDLYGEFLFSQVYYDYAFPKGDAALGSAVWCSFFNKEDVDPRYIEAVVSYIRYQMNHLSKLDLEALNLSEEKSGIWAPARTKLEEVFKKS